MQRGGAVDGCDRVQLEGGGARGVYVAAGEGDLHAGGQHAGPIERSGGPVGDGAIDERPGGVELSFCQA